MRLSYDEIKEKYGVDEIWSWSKFHTYETSPYEYFLKYVAKKKPDNENSAYAPYGNACHKILEDFYDNEIKYEEMLGKFLDECILLDIGEFKFDRTNETKNNNIKTKYLYDVEHFFKNHNKIEGKFVLEQFMPIKIGEHFFQGYIDMLRVDEDGNYIIQDWKTSSIYKNEKAISEAGQLILYAIGINQKGVPLNKVKCCWNFLKYADVVITQSNGEPKIRQIERCDIGNNLKSNAKMWLKKLGYDSDYTNNCVAELIKTNDISVLPKDVREKFKVSDCYVYVDFTQEHIDEITNRILQGVSEIKQKTNKYLTDFNENVFYDDEEKVKKQSFYFANLSSYSSKLHKPYANYLKVTSKLGEKSSKFLVKNTKNETKIQKEQEFTGELSWLNDI